MSRKAKLKASTRNVTVKQVMAALDFIRTLTTRTEKRLSGSAVAAILRHTEVQDLKTIHRVTISRWLDNKTEAQASRIHQLTKNIIVLAEKHLRAWDTKPEVIRCGLIEHATEFSPLHVLVHLSKKEAKELGGMKVEPTYMKSVEELVEALKDDKVDCIAAPRHFYEPPYHDNYSDLKKHPVRRFFKIATIKPQAIFAFPKDKDGKPSYKTDYDLQQVVRALSKQKPRPFIGVLPNVGYDGLIESFARANEATVQTLPVANYQEAFEALKSGRAVACVGHPIFIHNTMTLVKKHRGELAGDENRNLEGLEIVENPPFDEIKVEIFVNLPMMEERKNLAAMLFHAVNEAMEYMHGHKSIKGILDDILELKEAPKCHADDIFDSTFGDAYRFEIETFPVKTLRKLWKWKPVLRAPESEEV